MKNFFCSLLIFISIICTVNAAIINGEMLPVSALTLKEGDVFEGTIRIWPVESTDPLRKYGWEGRTYLNSFLLFQLSSVEPSENNADVLEIRGLFVVKGSEVQPSHNLVVGDVNASVLWKGPAISKISSRGKEYFIENQSVFNRNNWLLIGLLLAGLLVLVFLVGRFISKRKSRKILLEYTPERFDEIFRAAGTREEFERIYSLKNSWISLLKNQTPSHADFMKIMNQHQYKKHWGADELNEVKSSFENIRRSFSV